MRRFISTNTAPSMFSRLALLGNGSIFTWRPVTNIQELIGLEFIDSLNNNGVKGWLKEQGLVIFDDRSKFEKDGPIQFQLEEGDELILVLDFPGSLDKIARYKDSNTLPESAKPIFFKIIGERIRE